MDIQDLKDRLYELNIHPKKSLGQNFLINPILAKRILQFIKDIRPRRIIEIGPGPGSLTEYLLQLDTPLTLIELDQKLCDYWKSRGANILYGDVLRMEESVFDGPSTLVGNLPYQVVSGLIIESCVRMHGVESMVFMIQKEVGARLLSSNKKKDFGFLSVITQTFWNIAYMCEADTTDFYPAPQVKGWVLSFKKKPKPDVDAQDFLDFVKMCFMQKRKVLLSKLKKQIGTKVLNIFDEVQIHSQARAEDLTPEQYMDLYKKLL